MTAKWRLLGKAIEREVEKAERIFKCICLQHNLIIDMEGPFNPAISQEAVEYYKEQQAVFLAVLQRSVDLQKRLKTFEMPSKLTVMDLVQSRGRTSTLMFKIRQRIIISTN
jgi:hypothetical protein